MDHRPAPVEIFPGVSFRSDILPVTEEGGGRVHVVVTDLRTPGVQLYVTPPDPAALAKGFFYRLRWISEVTRTEQLSVVVNAAMFASQPQFWLPLPGYLANSAWGTLVADHVVADVQHSDLLWFDDQLQSHLRPWDASLRAPDLAAAKWAIGGQIVLQNGQVASTDSLDRRPDSRTDGSDRPSESSLPCSRREPFAAAVFGMACEARCYRWHSTRRWQLQCDGHRVQTSGWCYRWSGLWRLATGGVLFWDSCPCGFAVEADGPNATICKMVAKYSKHVDADRCGYQLN